jgi:hypothetical protein
VVFKNSEELIEANINRRWLDHRFVEWFAANSAGGYLCPNIAIAK